MAEHGDGVSDAPGKAGGGGESAGGAYPNGVGENTGGEGGFTGHGGQSRVDYSGPGDSETPGEGGDNAVTGGE